MLWFSAIYLLSYFIIFRKIARIFYYSSFFECSLVSPYSKILFQRAFQTYLTEKCCQKDGPAPFTAVWFLSMVFKYIIALSRVAGPGILVRTGSGLLLGARILTRLFSWIGSGLNTRIVIQNYNNICCNKSFKNIYIFTVVKTNLNNLNSSPYFNYSNL